MAAYPFFRSGHVLDTNFCNNAADRPLVTIKTWQEFWNYMQIDPVELPWNADGKWTLRLLREKYGNVTWDDSGKIGKCYMKQDEIGTPKCVVVDFDTLEDGTVTVRDRDTTEQTRVKIEEL